MGLCTIQYPGVVLILTLGCAILTNAQSGGEISFGVDSLLVSEGPDNVQETQYTEVPVPLVRVGGTQGVVAVTVQIQNQSATDHFLALNQIATFNDGDSTASASFAVINNNTPKPNQTYLLQIVAISTPGVAMVGTKNTMLLTTLASDEPSGRIQFSLTSLVVSEPVGARSYLQIPVVRGPGIYGAVSVNFQVIQGPNLGVNDLYPTQGSISFGDLVATQNITIAILPNIIPTPNLTFVLTLLNPGGGALLATVGTQASITVVLNSPPVKFNQSTVQVAPSAGSLLLTVTRGYLDGSTSLIGPVGTSQSTINYATLDGMALANADYVPLNGTLTFPPGVTSQTITVFILNNPVPHGNVNFTVYLFNPSPDCILYPPSTVAVTVLLSSNAGGMVSFASSGQIVINRDGYSFANLTIKRSVGTITDVVVAWSVRNADNSLASGDFLAPNGTIVIPAGQSQVVLAIRPFNDGTPKPAQLFYVKLDGILSRLAQLDPAGTLFMTLIVADSNFFYGLVELANATGSVTAAVGVRTVQFGIVRGVAANGDIVVTCSVFYLPPGSTIMDSSALVTPVVNVTMPSGRTTATLSVQVQSNVYLEPTGSFYAFINKTSLVDGAYTLATPTNSPSIGARFSQSAPVGTAAASGPIGFAAGSLMVQGQVPATGLYAVQLQVVRSGTYGQATVSWVISIANPNNVNSTAGAIVIQDGAISANFSVFITSNRVPELDQQFNVTLTSVAEPNQRILLTQNKASIALPAHDYPAGVFSFSAASVGPFYITKSASTYLLLTVQRTGGALTSQQILYSVVPNGSSHFYGSVGVLYFSINQLQNTIGLAPVLDGIPQTNQSFSVVLSFVTPTTLATFGSPSNVSVTILATDDFRGVIYFSNTSLSFLIVEPHVSLSSSTATITVYRDRGTFGTISVLWSCTTAGANTSLSAASGEVVFQEGQRLANFTISALDDGIPEPNITYTITLVQATGGAKLGYQNLVSSVTILANDDPISFATSSVIASEGTNATFQVVRGIRANGVAVVNFAVIYQTASSNDVIVYPSGGTITFQPGQTVAQITMVIVSDGIPELDEILVVQLVSLSAGDAVLVPPTNATLLIPYNDYPSGLFQFAPNSLSFIASEGTYVTLIVQRLKGTVGTVQLQWEVVSNSSRLLPYFGFLTFGPGETTKSFQVLAVADGVPALEESFDVDLSIFSNTSYGAGLASGFETATITIPDSNYPYGVFRIPPLNRTLFVALNVPTNNTGLGVVTIPVERTYGLFGSVQVTWEVYDQATLPSFVDLFLLGLGNPWPPQIQPRPSTGTKAVNFTGVASNVLNVPSAYHPVISNGFTISCWIYPSAASNGVLVAKTNSTTSAIFYALSLVANGANFIIVFGYLPSAQAFGYQRVQTTVPTSNLTGGWHSLAVSVSGSVAVIYVDGAAVTTSSLQAPPTDGTGTLTVGGLPTGAELYIGGMQDARIYSSPLNSSQIMSINNSSVGQNLYPTSGVITYLPRVMAGNITIASVNRSTPEPNKYFSVMLTASNGGSQISQQQNTVQVIELKGNNANGIFGFASNLSTNLSEPGNLSLIVTRQGGAYDTVTLTWAIVPAVQGTSLVYNFVANTSQVVFPPGVRQSPLVVSTYRDGIPSLAQRFTVVLVSVVSSDGFVSTTPTSGASINNQLSQWNITVLENDHPYGLLQFNTTTLPPPGTLIPAATSSPVLYVDKSNRTSIMVYVARAMGMVGTISVDYRTQDGTASSSSATPDYVTTGGTLNFAPTDQVKAFPVTILDNLIPELWKNFYVVLANPKGGVGVPSIGSPLTITIRPSHDAAGVFAFSPSSSLVVVKERSSATVTIVRGGGSQGNASVSWFVLEQTMDLTPTSGTVTFAPGQMVAQFVISAVDDMIPEFQEVYRVMLLNATNGSRLNTTGLLLVNVSIPANHYPCGLFVFDATYRSLRVDYTVGNVELAVSREFGTAGNVGVVYSTLNSSSAAVTSLVPPENIAVTDVDYVPTSGTLWFAQGETIKTFNITILANTIPKLDIFVFINLTSAFLLSGAPNDPLAAPGVSSNESLASVVIVEHNNARGIIEFDSSLVVTVEPSSNFLLLRRRAGTYGVVTATWSTIPGSANPGADFYPTSGSVTFQQGDVLVAASVAIIDNNIPEFNKSFTVVLTSASGGAVLGTLLNTTVVILPSDDPNGALEFDQTSRLVQVGVPPSGSTTPIVLTVQRLGGSYGVIGVDWILTAANDSTNAVIEPLSGRLVFISGDISETITVWLESNNIPSITEEFNLILVNAVGGARVATNGVAKILVLAHDNPYGNVSLLNANTLLTEGPNNTVQMIPIVRSGGTFEDLVVTYSVQQLDLAAVATADGTSPLAYFFAPVANTALSGSLLRTVNTTVPSQCGSACLSDETCLSFSQLASSCQLYLATLATGALNSVSGASYYEKNQTKVRPFLLSIARSPNDFIATTNTVIFPAGATTASIPVLIVANQIPELDESFSVTLLSVQLRYPSTDPAKLSPSLGSLTVAKGTVRAHDDPYGRFYLVGSNGEHTVSVPKVQNLAVVLTVQRLGGSIGTVAVGWSVYNSTARQGVDFIAPGSVLVFPDGVKSQTFIVSVLNDGAPSRNQDFVVTLVNPTGGAVVAPLGGGVTDVVILASNRAAGIVGFSPLSRSAVVRVGTNVTLAVQRQWSALGVVQVSWNISGSGNVSAQFSAVSGTAIFAEGVNITNIVFGVINDTTPKLTTPYTVQLTSVQTLSPDITTPEAIAQLDAASVLATITVNASNYPHGVVEFQQQYVTSDQFSPVQLTLVREYGTFGAIDVTYQARVGTLRPLPLPNDTSLATLGVNFAGSNLTVRFQDGQQSVAIAAPILVDRTPDLNRVFLISLLAVSLVNASDPVAPPIIGGLSTIEVTILPHDNPQGILTFGQTDLFVNVTQSTLNVPVLRTAGTYGTVSTVYYIVSQSATNGSDYIVANYLDTLTFVPGQSVGYIGVSIVFNSIPSLDKTFCINLYQPQGGAVLGNITTTCITILSHDDPYGVFTIDTTSLNLIVDVASLIPSANVATVLVVRGGGTLGSITVPFQIQPSPNGDLSPLSGAIQFRPGDQAVSFQVTASMSSIPSLNKTYSVTLQPPLLGRLGNNIAATLTILAHSHPFGLFEVFAGDSGSSYVVEDTVGTLNFTIRRSYGLFGNVTVLLSTVDGSSVANVDYVPIYTYVAFAQGETTKRVSVVVIDNKLPRIDGVFSVSIVNITGGGDVGNQSSVNVTILSHDNAHGLIGFANASLSVAGQVSSLPNPIQLVVVRQAGVFGEVHVSWNISNNYMNIAPSSGEVVFLNGSSMATITLYIQPDRNPSLQAVYSVVLQSITQNGVPLGGDPSKGARLLPALSVASVTILAHNDPYGVFVWSPTIINASQSDVARTVAVVSIVRQAGSVGDVLIQYSTADVVQPRVQSAQSGVDYIPVISGATTVPDGETGTNISITILPQDVLKPLRCFLVNITNVTLLEQPQQGVYPRAISGQTTVTVCVVQDVVNRGQLNFNAVLNYQGTIGVADGVGAIFIPVNRTSGTVGTVGVTYSVTGVTAVAGTDYISNATSLQFSPGQVVQNIRINILGNSNPHPDKTLVVALTTPVGGCALGTWNSLTVTILKNADYNGVFSFASDSLLFLVPVSQTPTDPLGVVTFKVQRTRSFFGAVSVYWEVESAGRTALSPTNGSVSFAENVTLQTFQVRTVNTGMSQPMQAFVVSLVSVVGAGGRIADPSSATVAIQATTAITPVIGFSSYPTGIVISAGSVLTFKIVQSIPTQGTTSLASWAITPADSSLFVTVTDTVLFTTGLQSVTVSVQTLSNTIPAVPRAYTVSLVSTTQATLNISSSSFNVYVRAANNPHGAVQFAQGTFQAPKVASTVAIPLQRDGGVAGTLVVSFTVQSYPTVGYSAQNATDFVIYSKTVTVPDGNALGSIPVQIIDDMAPAPNKTFAITLTQVAVQGGLGANLSFVFPGDPTTLDQPPTLGASTQLLFTILQSGNPYGTVNIKTSEVKVSVGSTAQLNLTRSGGSYGTIAVQFALANGLASSQDYTVLGGGGSLVVFNPGQTTANIFLYINSNSVGTSAVDFFVVLTSVSGGGALGNTTTATVIIAANVISNGVVGFAQSTVYVNNPSISQGPISTTLTVNRVSSTTGVTNIQWQVTGPVPGTEAVDISSSTLQGVLTMQDGQSSGIIQVIILPTSVPEVQKTFTVSLTSASNNVAISSTTGTLSLVVSQYGNPYGEISFIGNDLTPFLVNELDATVNTFVLTLVRTGIVTDAATVAFAVSGYAVAQSVVPTSGSVTFQPGSSQVQISLGVLPDGVPELDTTYTVTLTSAMGPGIINALGSVATFTVPANNYPYGQFGISSAQLSGDMTSRSLSVSLFRLKGTFGAVQAQLTAVYSAQPGASYVNQTSQVVFGTNATTASLSLPVSVGAFLTPFAYFSLTISNVVVIIPVAGDGGTLPVILPNNSSTTVEISPNVSNPLIGFDQASLETRVDDSLAVNNVYMSITRQGLLGVVTVTWSSIGNGTITPSSGTLQMGPADSIATIFVTATPSDSYGLSELFVVQLSAVTQSNQLFPASVDPTRARSVIEPRGVVQILTKNYTAIEGQLASVIIWRRYGSSQDVTVTGVAIAPVQSAVLQYEVAAVPGVDFVSTPLSLTLRAGSTWGLIQIPLPNNTLVQRLRVFQFVLTAVVGGQGSSPLSPRLLSQGPNATVTIIDAQGGSGIFGFATSSVSVNVLGSPIVPVVVYRTGGSYGRVSVTVTTHGGNAVGLGPKAISGQSYLPVNVTLVFEEGVTQLQLPSGGIQIIDNNLPSVTEYLTVSLSNPPGGFALIASNLANLVVAIEAHDYPGGTVAFTTTSPVTLIDGAILSSTITVGRAIALVGANVTWTAVYPSGTTGQLLSNLLVATTGTVSFQVGQTSAQFVLTLNANQVPQAGVQFSVQLSTSDPLVAVGGTDLTVNAQTSRTSVFQFAPLSRNLVVTRSGTYTLGIQRVDGLMLTANVTYSLIGGVTTVSAGKISLSSALATRHYTAFLPKTLTFTPTTSQVQEISIQVTVLSVDVTSPLGFQVVISTSQPNLVQNSTSTIVITPLGTKATLLGYYFNSLIPTSSFTTLESLSAGLLSTITGGVITGQDSIQAQSIQYALDQLSQSASTIYSNYSIPFKSNMQQIFNHLLQDSTFTGQYGLSDSLKNFGYSLLSTLQCGDNDSQIIRATSFYLETLLSSRSDLHNRVFSGGVNFVRFPSQDLLIDVASQCLHVAYVEYVKPTIFDQPTLNAMALSIGIQEQVPKGKLEHPIVYRVATGGAGALPTSDSCLFWNTRINSTGLWVTGVSTAVVSSIPLTPVIQQSYVDCQCSVLGDVAVAAITDVYGWTLPAAISCAFVMFSMILVILLHLFYFKRTLSSTRVFLMLCFSVLSFQLVALADMFATSGVSSNGCIALGVFLQLTVLAQFMWILSLVFNLWLSLMGFSNGRDPLFAYILASWGVSIVVVVLTIVIGHYAAFLQFTDIYGLSADKSICFIPNVPTALLSTALPIVIAILLAVGLLSHSCYNWSRWEDFHNMYHSSFNKKDVPLLLTFFVLVFVTCLVGGLQMYLTKVYWFGAFVALNTIQGIYALVVYFLLGWQTLGFKHKKYGIGNDVEPLTIPGEPDFFQPASSLNSSRRQLSPYALEMKERQSRSPQSPPVVQFEKTERRSQSPQGNPQFEKTERRSQSPQGNPIIPLGINESLTRTVESEVTKERDSVVLSKSEDSENEDFDTKLYLVKTNAATEDFDSDRSSIGSEEGFAPRQKPSLVSEEYQIRRISIANTHL